MQRAPRPGAHVLPEAARELVEGRVERPAEELVSRLAAVPAEPTGGRVFQEPRQDGHLELVRPLALAVEVLVELTAQGGEQDGLAGVDAPHLVDGSGG